MYFINFLTSENYGKLLASFLSIYLFSVYILWVSLCHYTIILSGDQRELHVMLYYSREQMIRMHVFVTTYIAKTYSEHLLILIYVYPELGWIKNSRTSNRRH